MLEEHGVALFFCESMDRVHRLHRSLVTQHHKRVSQKSAAFRPSQWRTLKPSPELFFRFYAQEIDEIQMMSGSGFRMELTPGSWIRPLIIRTTFLADIATEPPVTQQ